MAKRADTVAGPPPISMPTPMASTICSFVTPASSACFMCHSRHDSQFKTIDMPTAISSF